MLTERVFDEVWPDPRRAWTVDEMPEQHREMLMQTLALMIKDNPEED